MKTYRHLFFDLDGTLWDFERNSEDTLKEIFPEFLKDFLWLYSLDEMLLIYHRINHSLWEDYKKGIVSREEVSVNRFRLTLEQVCPGAVPCAGEMAEAYVKRSPTRTLLLPGALEVVGKLSEKYELHLITNGFPEVQVPKMENAGLEPYFKTLTTSEECGCLKPCRRIFDYAMAKAGALPGLSLMIGDDPDGDIRGAMDAGMDAVYLYTGENPPAVKALYTIHSLSELLKLLA